MGKLRRNKTAGILIITAVYIAASAFGIFVYRLLPFDIWLRLLAADCAATVFVFIFSLLLRNASVYDPYWSVAPAVILSAFALSRGRLSPAGVTLLAVVIMWGLRLTANWAYTFQNLGRQDWRYAMLKEKTGVFYPLINLLGIHMFPTLVVYLFVLPGVYVVMSDAPASALSRAGAAVCAVALLLQATADAQMHRFRAGGSGGLIRDGLWRFSRHPNYLGEILMWWGVAAQALGTLGADPRLCAGAAVNTLMFLFISIPMADRRQSLKPGYAQYRAVTRSLLPLPKISCGRKTGPVSPRYEPKDADR